MCNQIQWVMIPQIGPGACDLLRMPGVMVPGHVTGGANGSRLEQAGAVSSVSPGYGSACVCDMSAVACFDLASLQLSVKCVSLPAAHDTLFISET